MVRNSATITERYTLPSKGLIYGEKFNPTITLRSWTTEEEMLRCSPNELDYENMAKVIDACIMEELPISAYDMCVGDYTFLLHKLRIVSKGKIYPMVVQCPNCGEIVKADVDLDTELVHEFDPDKGLDNEITLPVSGDVIKLSLQTPRKIDEVKIKAKEKKKKTGLNLDYSIMYSAMSYVSKVNGKVLNEVELENYIRKLNIEDLNTIRIKGLELDGKVGLDNSVIAKCKNCNYEIVTAFREQPNFLGPVVY